MGILDRLLAGAGLKAGAKAVKKKLDTLGESDEERRAREAREAEEQRREKTQLVLWIVGGAVGLVVLFALVMKLLKWFLGLGLLAGLGAGAYWLLKPRVTALLAARGERKAKREEQQLLVSREQQLEDELEALREKASSER